MTAARINRIWLIITVLLIVSIISIGTAVWLKYPRSQPVEIILPPATGFSGQIAVDGAVSNPGLYPLQAEDSLDSIIAAAGGFTGEADLTGIKLYVPRTSEQPPAQKIDINRAELWLLELLPDIGKTKAQAIIDYRRENGPFRTTSEITRVAGIGEATYQKIKNYITVSQ